ncbi:FmdB family transcriptional regulator [Nibricoccus sp. IMCC34717]|uniref:FmdB family transcriptional regulator n=1 Tax=Nibricoccus sp. IMCC34717 TaxID=3034021 RepID=UPI00384DE398
MPIYEYYCPDNHTVYQFYAKSLAQGQTVPKCPENPKFRMVKRVSAFAVTGGREAEKLSAERLSGEGQTGEGEGEDPRMERALNAMEREFDGIDENDPKAMGHMMRRMAELTGEKIDGEMEEVVRKLEEGVDPEKLDEQFGDGGGEDGEAGMEGTTEGTDRTEGEGEPAGRKLRGRAGEGGSRRALRVDPKLYDYE